MPLPKFFELGANVTATATANEPYILSAWP